MPVVETKGSASSQGFGEFAKSGGAANYIEDVFSTYLYTGNGTTQTITNAIDLSGKGGLVWIKQRDGSVYNNTLTDTVRGVSKFLYSDQTNAQETYSGYGVTAFNSNGFAVTDATYYGVNASNSTYASWTFRKQAKFFDIQTWSGDGTAQRAISHNLGSVPGCIIVKCTDASTSSDWIVWHRSLSTTTSDLVLNTTAAEADYGLFGTTAPTSTNFYLGVSTNGLVDYYNKSGRSYIAYIFAHNAGGFGLTGTDNVISCGSLTTATAGVNVNLGYEPQWLLIKSASTADTGWIILDTMRGWTVGGTDNYLVANTTDAEVTGTNFGYPTSTGFFINNLGNGVNYIYIAIRRGPMKTPTSGTSVFSPLATNNVSGTTNTTGFPVDMQINAERGGVHATYVVDRLRGVITTPTDASSPYLRTDSTGVENPETITRYWNNTGYQTSLFQNNSGTVWWNFGRAPSFMDVVCWTGTGAYAIVNHNLGVKPQLIICKNRSAVKNWIVWETGISDTAYDGLILNSTAAKAQEIPIDGVSSTQFATYPAATGSFSGNGTSISGNNYVAYLFATCAGVSKVGSYTGTGTTLQIDCGFTGGARFVLIKRTDSTGDWYVWDSARGIVAGNDPYLLLNSTAAEVTNTDYVDTYSAGFEISSTAPAAINANGGSFIFLAVA